MVFILAYTIPSNSLMQPNRDVEWKIFSALFKHGIWELFGGLKDELTGVSDSNVYESWWKVSSQLRDYYFARKWIPVRLEWDQFHPIRAWNAVLVTTDPPWCLSICREYSAHKSADCEVCVSENQPPPLSILFRLYLLGKFGYTSLKGNGSWLNHKKFILSCSFKSEA